MATGWFLILPLLGDWHITPVLFLKCFQEPVSEEIMEVLKDLKKVPKLDREIDDFVLPFNPKLTAEAVKIGMMLRKKGRVVDVAMKKYRKIKTAFSFADRIGARRVIFVAPSELEKGMVKVKDLRSIKEKDDKGIEMKIEDL